MVSSFGTWLGNWLGSWFGLVAVKQFVYLTVSVERDRLFTMRADGFSKAMYGGINALTARADGAVLTMEGDSTLTLEAQ